MTFRTPYDTWFPDAAFDGSYGFDLPALRAVSPVPPPDGFAERWRGWHREARAIPPTPEALTEAHGHGRRVSVIAHTAADGTRLRAWVAEPRRTPARVGVVHGHGYGGREAPEFHRVPDDAWAIFPVARGLGALNRGVGGPEAAEEHVVADLDDPDRAVLGLSARDLWTAASALQEIAGDLPLYYVGESFGGGIGALALPWDERFVGATLVVPSFGQYDERLAVPCLGSGEAVRRAVARRPGLREDLRWLDASTAATFLRIPVRVEAALWDQYVPPQGQFAVANAIERAGGDLDLVVLPAGHAEHPGLGRVVRDAIAGGRAHLDRVVPGERRSPRL
ncbi:acetylesterase [Microbacterium resistens]|uniref:acetylesterase n=1 Tax=Microbacterium resistens TaxID=156977 RepID=UPI00366FBC71